MWKTVWKFPFHVEIHAVFLGETKMKLWGIGKEIFLILFGSLVAAAAIYFFLVPSNVAVGSVSGLAIVMEKFIPLKLSVITFILNAVLLIVGFIFVGKEFGVKTVCTSLLIPVMMGGLELVFPNNTSIMGDSFQDMLCYIFLVSIGQAILFYCNASSGGLDIIGKILNKYLRMELGQAISLAGMCVALSSSFVYDIKSVVLSILGTYISGIILDHFIFGFNIKKRVCIISKKEEEIADFILHQLHSGATYYEATGAYDNRSRREIITIVNKSEYTKLMNFISKTDKDAFVTVYAVSEIIYKPKI